MVWLDKIWQFWNVDAEHNKCVTAGQPSFSAVDASVKRCNDTCSAHCDATHPINKWPGQWPGETPAWSGYNGMQLVDCPSATSCVVMLLYDLLECGWGGCPNGAPHHDWVFSMRECQCVTA